MTSQAYSAAVVFQNLDMHRTQDDGHPDGCPKPAATGQEPLVPILHAENNVGIFEVVQDQPSGRRNRAEDTLNGTAWLYLLGAAVAVYLLALMFILFG